jgi:inner membrane protease subunit 2
MGTHERFGAGHDCDISVCWFDFDHVNRACSDITSRSPNNPNLQVVKRVLAKEGDTVITRAPCPVPTIQVPMNHIWVEGDNGDPNKTIDSNTYGPIPLNLVNGRLTYILSPWRRFGPIQWQEYNGPKRVIRGQRDQAPRW